MRLVTSLETHQIAAGNENAFSEKLKIVTIFSLSSTALGCLTAGVCWHKGIPFLGGETLVSHTLTFSLLGACFGLLVSLMHNPEDQSIHHIACM